MTDPDRKFVKPAHPGGRIPDHAHGQADLPQEGASVVWDHVWIARLARGEIVEATPPADPVEGTPPTGDETGA